MGKKNKKQNVENGKKNVENTQLKGGSAIAKDKSKQKTPAAANQNKNIAPKSPQPFSLKNNKNTVIPAKVDEQKLKEAATNIAGKKKRKRNKKTKHNGENAASPKDNASPVKVKNVSDAEDVKDDGVVSLTKRIKNRLKSKMRKEIALKGKSKLGLADPKLVARKLAKLKNKAEPHSKATQRNILMLEKLQKKLIKEEKKQHKKGDKNDASATSTKSGSDDEADSDGSDDGGQPKEKKAKANGKQNSEAIEKKKKDDRLYLFVGNLPKDITSDEITEHFKEAGPLQKIRIPVPRRNKCKRFAYIQMADEESQQKALLLHGSMIGTKKINILFADKSKGKSVLMSKNAKLNVLRKEATPNKEKAVVKKNKNKQKQKTK